MRTQQLRTMTLDEMHKRLSRFSKPDRDFIVEAVALKQLDSHQPRVTRRKRTRKAQG